MTDRLHLLTYTGRQPRGSVALPTRSVRFARGGDPVGFTAAEALLLDRGDWTGDWPDPPADVEPVGRVVPASIGFTAEDGPAFELAPGQELGTVDEVKALATTPARAAVLLEAEQATKNRKTLVAWLTGQTGDGTITEPAVEAADQEA